MQRLGLIIAAAVLSLGATCSAADPAETAEQLVGQSCVQGGLVVHFPCGDGRVTGALRTSEAWLVHGLADSPESRDRARAVVREQGVYGPVSVDLWNGGGLPYIDNSVNLLIVQGPTGVDSAELLRVLSPRGVALIRAGEGSATATRGQAVEIDGQQWSKIVKPVPENIDEWTHYMHDPGNNAVAHDTAIGPLRHLQWDGGPRYSRHHEFTSSVAAMVSAQGRLFSIIDMGSRASIHLPAKWQLTARDAFNGIVLWQRPIDSWFNHLWPLKDGPAQPPRRLVAAGDSVYVTLGLDAPVSRLDAATGQVLATYPGTEFTEEILFVDGTLILLKNDSSMNPADYYPKLMVCWDEKDRTMRESEGYLLEPSTRHVLAVDAESGKVLWQTDTAIEPLTLAADQAQVYFHDWTRVICLDRETGGKQWESEPLAPRENMGYVYGPTLVAYDDVVLFADGRRQRKIFGVAKEDGRGLLWEAPHYPAGHAGSPEDLMVVDGLVWCGKIAGGKDSGVFTGRDPRTGQVQREFTPDVETYWFHHRCYRAKATDKYILTSRTGIEFVDVREQSWETHHWVRGACTYGIMPCNGLVYAPPHPCACYLESKMSGLCALAPARSASEGEQGAEGRRQGAGSSEQGAGSSEQGAGSSEQGAGSSEQGAGSSEQGAGSSEQGAGSSEQGAGSTARGAESQERLVKGPAYGAALDGGDPAVDLPSPPSSLQPVSDWPTYRHDFARSGTTATQVQLPLATQWDVALAGRLTAPVVAGGRVFLASQQTHTVHALDARTGAEDWMFAVGGRVDSPPTVVDGRVIFGSADGRVYCLRAADGALVWQFAAAPRDLRVVSYGRLESVWPVHGSVLVRDGVAYVLAGRSTLLDGGLRFYQLDVATGEVISERTLYDQQNPQQDVSVLNMPVASTDILSSDGELVYMLSQAFDLQGNRVQTVDPALDPLERVTAQLGQGAHLFSPTGFLDDDAWHRSYWVYGRAFSSGCNWWYRAGRYAPAGRMLVFDDDRVYGFGRDPGLFVWSHVLENHLFSIAKQADAEAIASVRKWSDRSGRDAVFNRRFTRDTPVQERLAPNLHWSVTRPPLHARALVLADDTLLVAGPPDVVDEDEAFERPFDADVQANLAAQDAAYAGDGGGMLLALSAADGQTVCQLELGSPPVWDGMAVADDRVYLATLDGHVLCLGGER